MQLNIMLKLKVIQGLICYNIIRKFKKLHSFDKKHRYYSKYYRANTTCHAVKVDTVWNL